MPFVNDTVIVYVLDMPRMTVSVTVEQLHEVADLRG